MRIAPYKDTETSGRLLLWIETLRQKLKPTPEWIEGDGSPEGVLYASKNTHYFNRTGSAGTLLYVKNSASSLNTGWVAYG